MNFLGSIETVPPKWYERKILIFGRELARSLNLICIALGRHIVANTEFRVVYKRQLRVLTLYTVSTRIQFTTFSTSHQIPRESGSRHKTLRLSSPLFASFTRMQGPVVTLSRFIFLIICDVWHASFHVQWIYPLREQGNIHNFLYKMAYDLFYVFFNKLNIYRKDFIFPWLKSYKK